jgi:hypothetical protein
VAVSHGMQNLPQSFAASAALNALSANCVERSGD